MARPSDADSAATYDRIVETTHRLIAERGVSGITLRRVAEASGQSLGAITYYFENRAGLLEACLDAGYAWFRDEVRVATDRITAGGDLPVEIDRFVRRLFERARAHQGVLRTRLLTTMSAGALPVRRLRGELTPQLEKVSAVLGALGGGAPRDSQIRLAAHTLELIVVRYALHTDEELQSITGLADLEEALEAVRQHLVRLSVDMFVAAMSADDI